MAKLTGKVDVNVSCNCENFKVKETSLCDDCINNFCEMFGGGGKVLGQCPDFMAKEEPLYKDPTTSEIIDSVDRAIEQELKAKDIEIEALKSTIETLKPKVNYGVYDTKGLHLSMIKELGLEVKNITSARDNIFEGLVLKQACLVSKDKEIEALSEKLLNEERLSLDRYHSGCTHHEKTFTLKDKIKRQAVALSGLNKCLAEKNIEIKRLNDFNRRESAIYKNKADRLEEAVDELKLKNKSLKHVKNLVDCIASDSCNINTDII